MKHFFLLINPNAQRCRRDNNDLKKEKKKKEKGRSAPKSRNKYNKITLFVMK